MSKRKNSQHWSGYDKKHFKQLVNEEDDDFMSQIPQTSSEKQSTTTKPVVVHPVESDSESLSDSETQFDEYSDVVWEEFLCEIENSFECDNQGESSQNNIKKDLATDLAGFVVRKGRPTRDTTELLHILNNHNVEGLPKTRNNLLKTPKEKIEQRPLSGGGTFYYRGIRKSLEARKHLLSDCDEIVLDVGIDGARPFKASKIDLWPCMSSIANSQNIRPFLLGIFLS